MYQEAAHQEQWDWLKAHVGQTSVAAMEWMERRLESMHHSYEMACQSRNAERDRANKAEMQRDELQERLDLLNGELTTAYMIGLEKGKELNKEKQWPIGAPEKAEK